VCEFARNKLFVSVRFNEESRRKKAAEVLLRLRNEITMQLSGKTVRNGKQY
jgi:hypothetical protein